MQPTTIQSNLYQLASSAYRLGLEPVPLSRARILVLGQALDAASLCGCLLGLPTAECLWITDDAAQQQTLQALSQSLALKNLHVQPAAVTALENWPGTFDYLLLAGLSAWEPAQQRALLSHCAAHLRPQGVLAVQYATQPGWQLRQTVRPLLAAAKTDWQAALMPLLDAVSGSHLAEEGVFLASWLAATDCPALPEQANYPLYFHEFAALSQALGLHYLGESTSNSVSDPQASPAQRILQEQGQDFLQHRAQRHSLLCHSAAVSAAEPAMALQNRYLAFAYQALTEQPGLNHPGLSVRFVHPQQGEVVEATVPLVKAALWCLAQHWPQALSFEALCAQSCACLQALGARLPAADDPDLRASLAAHLWTYAQSQSLELHAEPLPLCAPASAMPLASPLARQQFAAQPNQGEVHNLRGEKLTLDPLLGNLLLHLDGTQDRAALITRLLGWARRGLIRPNAGAEEVEATPDLMAELLERALSALAQRALLSS